jgi:hypothetical protein
LGRSRGDSSASHGLTGKTLSLSRLMPLTENATLIEVSYRVNHSSDWNWFESVLAYSNARLPQALIRVGMRVANEEMVLAGLEALDWLGTIQRCDVKGHFVPIGSQGFYSKKTERARFDQQPVARPRGDSDK